MKKPIKIAYYAPLKSPNHPIPSGDRQMARMLFAALQKAGYEVELASEYISYSKRHSNEYLEARKAGALAEADRLLKKWRAEDAKPDLWFSYHPYDKSPDWMGCEICSRLNIPMVTAEPCKTGQGPNGEWLPWRKEAQKHIAMAKMNIVMTHSDRKYLRTFVPDDRVTWMPPFIDADLLQTDPEFDAVSCWNAEGSIDEASPIRLLCAGMMRPGAKMNSYHVLADALKKVDSKNWKLVIAGGGPGADEVGELFAWAGDRINIVGERTAEQVISLMQAADILAWPGCREAYGMVYLEAASFGVPAVALDNMGVPLVVEHERTGLLASPAR